MHHRRFLALTGATLAFVLAPSAAALAANSTKVTVRVEGNTRTLLAPTIVQTHTGSITQGGAPAGACPAASAAGALDVATHHGWSGTFFSSFNDYEIKTILGDTENGKKSYWGIWVNNAYATTGACEIKLKPGDQLLFAVDSVAHHEHPLGLTAAPQAKAGRSFKVKVVSYSDAGVAKPLAGVQVSGAGVKGVTNRNGILTISEPHAGTVVLRAHRTGYIRAAPVSVRVSS
jgi:Domain of unknown function (DUF4430)